jgi:hypothetical protein
MNTWNMVIKGMKTVPDLGTQEFLFYEAVKDHRELSEDIAHYKRLGEGSTDSHRSLEFLVDSVNRCLKIAREESNRKALTRTLGGAAPAAPAPKKDGKKGKGKGKDKGKGKGKVITDADRKKLACRFFAEGNCKHGVDCKYSHAKPAAPFTGGGGGKGKGKGKKGDGKDKLPCKFFAETGTCKYGEKCKFTHSAKAAPAAKPKAKPKAKAAGCCRFSMPALIC